MRQQKHAHVPVEEIENASTCDTNFEWVYIYIGIYT